MTILEILAKANAILAMETAILEQKNRAKRIGLKRELNEVACVLADSLADNVPRCGGTLDRYKSVRNEMKELAYNQGQELESIVGNKLTEVGIRVGLESWASRDRRTADAVRI